MIDGNADSMVDRKVVKGRYLSGGNKGRLTVHDLKCRGRQKHGDQQHHGEYMER